jgi:hypothetical protein
MTLTWDYPYLTGNTDADIVEKFTILTSPFVGKKVRQALPVHTPSPAPPSCQAVALCHNWACSDFVYMEATWVGGSTGRCPMSLTLRDNLQCR